MATLADVPSTRPVRAASKRPGRVRLGEWSVPLLALPAAAFMLGLFVYPFVYGFDLSLRPDGTNLSLDNYLAFFQDPRQLQSILVTFEIAVPVSIVSVVLAVPLALYMRRGVFGERVINTLLILPVTLGTVLIAEGMLSYFGPRGWFSQVVQLLPGVVDPPRLTHNLIGVQLSLLIQGLPLSFLLLLGHASGIDPGLERAAAMLGASKWQTFTRVTLPLMAPGIAIAFSLGFVTNFSVFPSAILVGQPSGPTRVLAIAAFQAAFEQFNWSMGSAIAIVMGVIELVVIVLVLIWRETLFKGAASGAGKG